MPQRIFINLPVEDLPRATEFYEAIGAEKNPKFSDDTASGMSMSDTIKVMLLTHEKMKQFAPRPIADARKSNEVLLCIQMDTKEAVDALVSKAGAAGGGIDPGPVMEMENLMYGRSFEDPDGHIWEVMWMSAEMETNGCPDATADC